MNAYIEKELKRRFEEGFEKMRRNGLKQGVLAVSKVVLDKANDTSKSPEERLSEIVRICEAPFKNQEEREVLRNE